ncbi:hypothetical protein [Caldimonas sp. KR1-144]|uniref:hypothetical protein n=1 Tax=Caldimonas sp. KR1-144 TaxID=3400911 RepID=UPI003BFC614C
MSITYSRMLLLAIRAHRRANEGAGKPGSVPAIQDVPTALPAVDAPQDRVPSSVDVNAEARITGPILMNRKW